MSTFNLPDLGEGLPDAEIREWYVAVGDTINEDQPLCAMETAKALVDVPSPFSGTVTKLYGNSGDIIQTGAPLVSYQVEGEQDAPDASAESASSKEADAGTVVGAIVVGSTILKESATGIATSGQQQGKRVKATLKVRKLAKQLNIDLSELTGSGPSGAITEADVNSASAGGSASNTAQEGFEALHGPSRGMAFVMARAHEQVADVTLVEDADIHHYGKNDNITLRIVRAIEHACKTEPKLNAHFDGSNSTFKLFDTLNLAMAVDTPSGLYAPVIRGINQLNNEQIRDHIQDFKKHAQAQDFPPEMLSDATFTLSNFGVFTGRYANPMIMPPTVAILGVGKVRKAVVPVNDEPTVHRILPLSITVDHRFITGGEAARFMAALITHLEQ